MNKKIVIGGAFLGALLIGGGVYWKTLQLQRPTVPIPQPSAQITDKNTVAHNWQWQSFTEKKASAKSADDTEGNTPPVDEVPYDVVRIYDMLQEVRLDDAGNVVIDSDAKRALEKAFSELGSDIGPFGISQLQELIRIGLPGAAGEQTAEILAQYYDYRLAEAELLKQAQASSMEEEIQNYEQLVNLRRSYLGHEVAEKLFVEEELQSRHMFAAMRLLRDPNLSDEEKQQQQEQLQQRLNEQLASHNLLNTELAMRERVAQLREQGASEAEIFSARAAFVGSEQAQALAQADREEQQWQQRFSRYWQERQQIIDAGLDEEDQREQIELLLSRHFTSEEIERARNMQPPAN